MGDWENVCPAISNPIAINPILMFMKFLFKITANDRALCRCGIRIPSARNRCPAFAKDKCLEPMFGDVGQARTKARICITDD